MPRKLILTITASLFIFGAVFGGTVIKQYNFNPPRLAENAGMTVLQMDNCIPGGEAGNPALPVFGSKLLLPPGESIISVKIVFSDKILIFEGVEIDPVQAPIALSYQGPFSPTPKNPAVYNSGDIFPGEAVANTLTQFMCGFSLGYVSLVPVEYQPLSGKVYYYPSVQVEITTAPTAEASEAHNKLYRGIDSDFARAEAKVDNPEQTSLYSPTLGGTDEPFIPYLVITIESLAPSFTPFLDYKNSLGFVSETITVNEIQSQYQGIDLQEKIRNCIIDYYLFYHTSYVLLAADVEYLPHRGLYATMNGGGEIDDDIPGDIYYAALDGNWNTDGDDLWGEVGEYDLLHEVVLGRACVDSPSEAANWVNKQLDYQSDPIAGMLETALMVGEDLEWETWGSDLKEEIRLGTSYTQGFPANFTVGTLYDTPTWSFSGMNDLMPLLNMGPNLVNHMGHASTTYMMKFNNNNINDNNCTNNGDNANFYIVYSQGCYCGAFDNRTAYGSYTNDCITEQFNNIAHGAVCMITNSRYGWGNYSGTNGPSQYYDREFFDALFGEEISMIGAVNNDSKEDNIPYLGNATLWCYYELNLFGDPTLDIWTGEPMELEPEYQPSLIVGATELEVEVPGVEGAYCAITNDGQLMGAAFTNASGYATIEFEAPIATLDTLTLAVTAHNYYPYIDDELVVITPNMPFIIIDDMSVNDAEWGDDDGALDLGEAGYLQVDFHNVGLVATEGVYAKVTCEDEIITLVNDSIFVGEIAPESITQVAEAFEYSIGFPVADGYQIECLITVFDALDSMWIYDFDFSISAPEAIVANVQVYDGENMRLSPGETAEIELTLGNTGSGEIREGYAEIICDNQNVTLNIAEATVEVVEAGMTAAMEPRFNITVEADCPNNAIIPIYIDLTDGRGYAEQLLFEIPIGGFFDNMEMGEGDWTHNSVSEGFTDHWGMDYLRNHSLGGLWAWYIGDPPNYFYADSCDAALVTPAMELPESAKLTFWHFMDAETTSQYVGQAWDGGKVEMAYSANMIFFPINPVGGYPHFIAVNQSAPGPFGNSTPVYSGQFDWTKAEFDLTIFPGGEVHFRFRFGSDGAGTPREGWWIDDVELVPIAPINPPTNFNASIDINMVHLSWNSPAVETDGIGVKSGGEKDTESLMGYNIYRNMEIIAENVAALEYFDNLEGMPYGDYIYIVAAVYSGGQTAGADPLTVHYDGTPVISVEPAIPLNYFIEQNYPNPFNPETSFRYGLPEAGKVSLTVYNISGQEVTRLVEGFQPAGYHTAVWKADNLPSGIYLYRLETAGLKQSGKMLLLK